MTILNFTLGIIILIFVSLTIFLLWYIINAVRQIRDAETFTHDLILGIEELKEGMQIYINHVNVVNELEMFYGDETLRELIRHGKSLVETFDEYKVDYFPILDMEEKTYNEHKLKFYSAPEGD